MRAAAAALVLIIGAVVILVFANTLNSWVLGGLIGGLAALLISIPVSLLLFTILARRHEQELQTLQQELEEMAYADLENEYAEVYETDVYVLPDEEEFYNEPGRHRSPDMRALPAAGQSQASTQRSGNYAQGYRRPAQALPQALRKGTPTRQLSPDRRQLKRSAHEVNAMRAKFQTAALREARREAALEFDDVEVMPTHSSAPYKRVLPPHASQPLTEQPTRFRQGPLRELQLRQEQTAGLNSSRRPVDAASSQQHGARRTPSSGEVNLSHKAPQTDALHMREPRTDQLRDRFPQTGPIYPGSQTAQSVGDSQLIEQLRNPDMITGSLKNPIVRRAPYMYEDDSLREELAQQIERPIKRRSSLFLPNEDREE